VAIATLPIVLSVVLAELAIGGSFVMWLVDRGGRAPSGLLKLVAFVDAGAIAAALALVPTFPGGDLAARAGVDTGPLSAFGQALVLVTILMVIQLVTTFLPARGPPSFAPVEGGSPTAMARFRQDGSSKRQ
jgi:hypothetical protein